jgi:uncharacterized membrane protein YfcA
MSADMLVLVVAGVVSGMVGSAGGTASLVSYPALLAAGLPAFAANVTNSVAFIACWPGSAFGSRPELRGQGAWLKRWAPLAAVSAAGGAALLLLTPAVLFDRAVPFLVAFAALVLLFQPWISGWLADQGTSSRGLLLPCGLVAVAVYDGYWGAGSGIMTIALLLLSVDPHLARANALKNMILGVTGVASSVGFILFGPVDWTAAVPLAIGLLVGSTIGPSLTRRVPAHVMRTLAGLAGLGLAVHLWLAM